MALARSGQPIGRSLAEEHPLPSGSPDWVLVGAVAALTAIGLVFVYSSSFALSLQLYGDTRYFITRQLIGAAIGVAAFIACAMIDYRVWRKLAPALMIAAVLGLLAVLVPGIGHEQNDARRWIQIGSLPAVQPSEFAKLGIFVYVAAWLASRGDQIRHVPLGLVPFGLIIGLIFGLLMAEPDLGTFVAIAAVCFVMFFLAGASVRHIAVLAGIGAGVLLIVIFVAGYGLDRIRTFFSAEDFAQDSGFQIVNLVNTLGSGGLTGVGIGESRQKFFYVPSAHSDGVFAIIGEETGLLGALMLLGLMGILIYRGARTAMNAPDRFGSLLAFGIVAWLAIQSFLNIAGVTRTIVLTGIPLPFMSFGGSALIATLAAAGVLVAISRRSRVAAAAYARDGARDDAARDRPPPLELEELPDDPFPRRRGAGR